MIIPQEIFQRIKEPYGLQYIGIETDHKTIYNCDQYCEDACRCAQITNAWVTEINFRAVRRTICYGGAFALDDYTYLRSNTKPSLDPLAEYCIDRLMTSMQLMKPKHWQIDIEGGFYGDEIGLIHLTQDKEQELLTYISSLQSFTDNEAIQYCLSQEYGQLLPILSNTSFADILEIPINSIQSFQQEHMKSCSNTDLSHYKDYELPCGIVMMQGNGETYRLIDGYHRYTVAKQNNKQQVKVIVLS